MEASRCCLCEAVVGRSVPANRTMLGVPVSKFEPVKEVMSRSRVYKFRDPKRGAVAGYLCDGCFEKLSPSEKRHVS